MRVLYKKFIFCTLALCLPVCIAAPCDAAVVLRFDADPAIGGGQSDRDVGLGESFDVSLFMDITDATNVASYTLSVRYDKTKLAFVSGSDPLPAGFQFGDTSVIATSVPGETFDDIDGIDGTSFAGGVTGPISFEIASFTFRAISDQRISPFDITAGLFGKPQNEFRNSAFGVIDQGQISVQGANINVITAIPEPTFVGLLMLGGTIVVSQRRRRR
ncbi:MAG: PEP-CTERM sorting domain-containing protein [Planctomycetales bacterium]|nr:PEP-CTERM sorting domain-containing protein [Planctomycetales bacterium]